MAVDRLFVYGTLRPGEAAHALLAPHITSSRSATIAGALFAFAEGHPGALSGPGGRIAGDVVDLIDADRAFAALDPYEGPEFARQIVEVTLADGEHMPAWCYVLADDALAAAAAPIPGGDWTAYRRSAR